MYFFFFFFDWRKVKGLRVFDRFFLFLQLGRGIFRIEFGSTVDRVLRQISRFERNHLEFVSSRSIFRHGVQKRLVWIRSYTGMDRSKEFWVWSGWGPSGGKGIGNECASRWSSSIVRETRMPGCCDLWPLFRDRGWFSLRESIPWEWLEDVGELLSFPCKK